GGLPAAEADVRLDAVGLGQGDVLDEQPDHAFAFPLRGGRVTPQGGEVAGQRVDAVGVLAGERDGRGRSGLVVLVLGVLHRGQCLVPVGFQAGGDQPVARVDGQVAAAGEVGG